MHVLTRSLVNFGAALAILAPAGAEAQTWSGGACPALATAEVIARLGAPLGSLRDGEGDQAVVHRPVGLTVLDERVAYAVVEYDAEGPGYVRVEAISFRLGEHHRAEGRTYPLTLLRTFDAAYPMQACERTREAVCTAFTGASGRGEMFVAELADRDFQIDEQGDAAARRLVKADQSSGRGPPAFLVCSYNEGARIG